MKQTNGERGWQDREKRNLFSLFSLSIQIDSPSFPNRFNLFSNDFELLENDVNSRRQKIFGFVDTCRFNVDCKTNREVKEVREGEEEGKSAKLLGRTNAKHPWEGQASPLSTSQRVREDVRRRRNQIVKLT